MIFPQSIVVEVFAEHLFFCFGYREAEVGNGRFSGVAETPVITGVAHRSRTDDLSITNEML